VARLIAARLATVIGIAVCSGLVVETLASGSASCGHGGVCDEVLNSAWGRPGGVPLPMVGLGLFVTMLGLSLSRGQGPARLFRLLALAGGVGGVGLVVVQAVILRRYCPFCLVVDGAAVCAALSALRGDTPGSIVEKGKWVAPTWFAAGLLGAIVGGTLWLVARPVEPPAQLLALSRPDRVTIVEIADFRCGHCRVMHRVLDMLEAEMGDRVHRVCLIVPTPDRPEGREVSRALQCARQQGRERAMIDRLFAGPYPTPERCRQAAAALNFSLPPFDACLAGTAVDGERDDELAWLDAASPRGVPAVWMDGRLLDGVRGLEKMRAAAARAERRREENAPR
jgi:uncharacterized membrane protein